jgi:hypothetical protein
MATRTHSQSQPVRQCCRDSLDDQGEGRNIAEPLHFCVHCSTEWQWCGGQLGWSHDDGRVTQHYMPRPRGGDSARPTTRKAR